MSSSISEAGPHDLLATYVSATVGLTAPASPQHVAGPPATELVADAAREHVLGVVVAAVSGGSLELDEQGRNLLARTHREAMAWCLLIERRLGELWSAMTSQGLTPIVLKGPASAHLDYPDPAMRAFADLDLLIPGDQIDDARRLIEALGGQRRYPELRDGYDRRFSKGISLALPDGMEIDLHRTVSPGPYGLRLPPGQLHRRRVPFPLGGQILSALDPPARFVTTCYHAVLGGASPHLGVLTDVAVTCPAGTQARLAMALAWTWGGSAVVARALGAASSALAWQLPEPWPDLLAGIRPTPLDRLYLTAYEGATRSSARQSLLSVVAVPGIADRLDYLRAHLAPQRTTGRSTMGRLRSGLTRLTGQHPAVA